MKTLHLMRHAKSAWDQPGLSDRERGLNKRGRRDAPRMGAALAAALSPQSITVSPATRAQLTLEGLVDGWPTLGDIQHRTDETLYTFASDDLLDWIFQQNDGQDQLFIIGHNPALTELINLLLGRWQLDNLPTAGYVCLELAAASWIDVSAGCATLSQRLFPKEIGAL